MIRRLSSAASCETASSSRELYLSFRVPVRTRPTPKRQTTSLGVPLPIATSALGVHVRGFPTTRFVPSSEFLTPSTASSALGLAGLFHPAATSGISPPGVSLSQSRATSSVAATLLPLGHPPLSPTCADDATAKGPDFRALLPTRVRSVAQGFSLRAARAPPGVSLLRVLRPLALPPLSRRLRSWP